MSANKLPVIQAVEPAEGLAVTVTWQDGRTETVDLAPMIHRFKIFRPLRNDPELFRSVRLGDHGASIVWTDDIDMDAVTVERLARLSRMDRMSAGEFRSFVERHRLTYDDAADALGIARRQLAYYLSGEKPIPRTVALACHGFETLDVA